MTAAELHELVKDVPECVPEALCYDRGDDSLGISPRWYVGDMDNGPCCLLDALHAADLITMHTLRMSGIKVHECPPELMLPVVLEVYRGGKAAQGKQCPFEQARKAEFERLIASGLPERVAYRRLVEQEFERARVRPTAQNSPQGSLWAWGCGQPVES